MDKNKILKELKRIASYSNSIKTFSKDVSCEKEEAFYKDFELDLNSLINKISSPKSKNIEEQQYLNILNKILKEGKFHKDRTGTGTYRIWGSQMFYSLENNKIPILTTKKVVPRLIIEELLWFLSGSTDVKKLQDKNVKIWNGNGSKEECAKFNREEGDLGPIYGHQWRNFGASSKEKPLDKDYWSENNLRWVNRAYNDDGEDQLKYIIDTINNNPDSRRILLSGWHPKEQSKVNPPPCHTFYQFQVEEGKLNGSLYMRSSDTFLGLNFNLSSLAIWTCLLAKVTNLEPGNIFITTGDTHLYSDHVDQAKLQISREPYPFPSLHINDRLKGRGLEGILDAKLEDFEIRDYKSHGSIKAKMSV